ncbi:MAG TPA: peptidase S8, partial [Bacillota bacterium]|nr:peptidase S8 [Bacillota bacterium]
MERGKKIQTKLISIFSIFLIVLSLIVPGAGMAKEAQGDKIAHLSSVDAKVSDRLLKQFESEKTVSFLLKFKQEADTDQAVQKAGEIAGQAETTAYETEMLQRSLVISELKSTAAESQLDVQGYLDDQVAKGNVERFHPYFIVNGISVTATEDVMKKLAAFPE